jgi:succinyl-CoA synthetase beta subunit
MNFEEQAAKPLLAAAGIRVPEGRLVTTAEAAGQAARELGPVVVKAQAPTGKRGKAGGIRPADSPAEAQAAASDILGMEIAGHRIERLLVERRAKIEKEYYAAILNDPESRSPLVLFSAMGGMDVEEAASEAPEALHRLAFDIRSGLTAAQAGALVADLLPETEAHAVAELLVKLAWVYQESDAELIEINPLAVTPDGELLALDCKLVLDDSAVKRREELAETGNPERLSGLEARGQGLGIKYIELDGNVGVMANGAGLTMTTMDVVSHYGGWPANFMEIGGEAYTKATEALELVLANPRVKSLVINFCGAFARTDVMTEGVIRAWEALQPKVPVFFSVNGTGDQEARALLGARLGIEPFATMDEACRAAVEAAQEAAVDAAVDAGGEPGV